MILLDSDIDISINWADENMDVVDAELTEALQEIQSLKEDCVGWLLARRNERLDAINTLLDICHGRIKA